MNRINKKFAELKEQGRSALVGFISAGDPDFDLSYEIIDAMCRAGLDVLELGVPFSDPTADGPVIQRSSQRALASGINMEKCMAMVGKLRIEHELPIILFSYYNPIFKYGVERFCNDAKIAGADGTLIVDLPPEEGAELKGKFTDDFSVIRLIAPNTSLNRVQSIASDGSGFLYVISKTGVTGSGGLDTEAVAKHVAQIKTITDLPLCVGFGISTAEQARAVAGCAEGVVIGSAFERLIEDNVGKSDLPEIMYSYVSEIRAALG